MSVNYLEKITEMYAFVSVDEGGEGLIAMGVNIAGQETFMPFVCADIDRVESLKPFAIEMSKKGRKIKLIKFTTREDIEEYLPNE